MAEPRTIAALAYPGLQLLDVVGPLETFNLASQQMLDDDETREHAYRVVVIAKQRAGVQSMSGLTVQAARDLSDSLTDVDTLLVPGALTGDSRFYEDPGYIEWIRAAAPQVRRLCSICSGALLLAAAGLLDGKRATTHWMDAADLKRNYPRVRVESNRIFLEDGGVFTSGGITAGIDLALALVERDHSRRLALKTAKRLLVFLKRPGNQLQFNSFLAAQLQPSHFEALLDWITENLNQELGVATLAKRACMSERTFRRKFEAELGVPARRYISHARITKAQSLLETTDSPLSTIAKRCGFKTVDNMRYAFSAELDVTPSDYRQRFGRARGNRKA